MARDYGKVHVSFWSSSTIAALSEDGRMLALYLMTSPHTTIAGVFRLPDGYASEDLRWDAERVREGFEELLANGFANRCETTKWVWITKHLEWNPPENPNQRKAAAKMAQQVPDECSWKPDFMRLCGQSLGIEPSPEPSPSPTVPKPFRNQKQEQEQDKHPSASADAGKPARAKTSESFERFWSAYPRKKSKGDAEKVWLRLKPDAALLARILAALDAAKASDDWRKEGGKYVPYPATWLNAKGWEDEFADVAAEHDASWAGAL